METRTRGIPVVIAAQAAVAALTALGAHRLALVHPPWFSAELDQEGAKYFASQGFDVVRSGPAGLPSDQQAIEPRELFDWVREHIPDKIDAVFIGGNGLRAIGVIKALEKSLDCPVLTGNQVAFWQCLMRSGSSARIENYGKIFDLPRPIHPA